MNVKVFTPNSYENIVYGVFSRSKQTETLSRSFNVTPNLAIWRLYITKSGNQTSMELSVRPELDNLSQTVAVFVTKDCSGPNIGNLRPYLPDQIKFNEKKEGLFESCHTETKQYESHK